jgi:hypothetical protein
MADNTEVAQQAPDLQGVLLQLFNGGVGNATKSLENLSKGITGANEIARANNEKGRNFYENYNNGGNLALLGMAGAIGDPTKHGVGAGFEGYANGLIKQREFDFTKQDKLQALQNAQAGLARQSATDQFDLGFMKPLEMMGPIGTAMGSIAGTVRPGGAVPDLFGGGGGAPPAKGVPMGVGVAPQGGGIPQGAMPPIQSSSLPPPTGGIPAQEGAAAMPPMSVEAAQRIGADFMANRQKYDNAEGQALVSSAANVLIQARTQAAGQATGQGGQQSIPAIPQADPMDPYGTIAAAQQVIDTVKRGPWLVQTNVQWAKAFEDAKKTLQESPAMQAAIAGAKKGAEKQAENANSIIHVYDENGEVQDRLVSDQIAKLRQTAASGSKSGDVGASEKSAFTEAKVKTYEAFNTDAMKHLKDSGVINYQLNSLAKIYDDYKSNRTASAVAELTSVMKAMGIPLSKGFEAETGGFDAAMKTAVAQAFKTMQDNGANRAPATALRESLLTTPSPENDPAANYKIITEGIAANRYMTDMYSAFADSGEKNVNEFLSKWGKTHDFKAYVDKARNETPAFKGMPSNNTIKALRPAMERGADAAKPNQSPAPNQLEVGKVYTNSSGLKGRWNGSSFDRVP